MNKFFNRTPQSFNLLDPSLVAANRSGQITSTQEQLVRSAPYGGRGFQQAFLLVIFLLLGGFYALLFSYESSLSDVWIPFLFIVLIVGMLVVKFGSGLVSGLQQSARLKRDLSHLGIQQGVGEMTFGKDGYVIFFNEQTLRIPVESNAGGLLPGLRYVVYYLSESGYVISAEAPHMFSDSSVSTAMNQVLAQVNKFSAEDLQTNRQGSFSDAQRRNILRGKLGGLAFSLIPLSLGILVLYLAFTSNDGAGDAIIAIIIGLIIMGSFLVMGILPFINAISDLNSATVASEQGRGNKHKEVRRSGRSSRTYFYYVINGRHFLVQHKAYLALLDGLEYRAYYAPKSGTLLSIEMIGR